MKSHIKRYLEAQILKDLNRKMVFISGPRQSGKTFLARILAGQADKSWYLNWDSREDRTTIMQESFPSGKGMIIFDEIHKFADWRRTIKGLYDKRSDELKILVTGSARLDYYRKGGDSLAGRYHHLRLFPLTLAEMPSQNARTLDKLLSLGWFPEPFLGGNPVEALRWSKEYRSRVITEDLAGLENVRDISLIELLSVRLPDLVGSPLSLNSLREDLEVAHLTVSRWLDMMERLFIIFRLYPFQPPRIKAVKKEAKHYQMDWTLVTKKGPRFENLVACHLLKWCSFQEDSEGRNVELRYFRNPRGEEVDFVVTDNGSPLWFIECKTGSDEVPKTLSFLKSKFPRAEAVLLTQEDTKDRTTKDGIRICPAHLFLSRLV